MKEEEIILIFCTIQTKMVAEKTELGVLKTYMKL